MQYIVWCDEQVYATSPSHTKTEKTGQHRCKICGICFNSIEELSAHSRLEHGTSAQSPAGVGWVQIHQYFFTSMLLVDTASVTAEMPGVDKEDIQVNLADEYVTIHAEKGDKKYHIDIPVNVGVRDSAKAAYTNGILELKIKLKENPKQ